MSKFTGEKFLEKFMEIDDPISRLIVIHLYCEKAINYTEKNLWKARGDVVAINAKNQEKLNTEYLVWDQKKGEISSNQKVQVSTPDDVIFGEGFRSDDSFDDWQVDKVTGVITFDGESYDEGAESAEE